MKSSTSVILSFFGLALVSFTQPLSDEVRVLENSAERGDAVAQFNLAVRYDNGEGVIENDAEAVKWYRKAAEQGDVDAQFNLGVMYTYGQGVPQDGVEAAKWYRKAAEQSNAVAQYKLGVIYANGYGVPQDGAEAAKWYHKSAKQGYADAQFNLGVIYANGYGVPQDGAEAAKWYRKAAEQGDVDAQFNLGVMYTYGQGVQQDGVEAAKWYRKAAEQGDEVARKRLEELGIERALVEPKNTVSPEKNIRQQSKNFSVVFAVRAVCGVVMLFIFMFVFESILYADSPTKAAKNESNDSDANDTGDEEIDVTPDHKININCATVEDLRAIPGVGNVAANAIVINRPFSNFNELLTLNQVGPVLVKKLQEWCTIEHPSLALIKTYEESLSDVSHEEKMVMLTVSIASLMANADHRIVPNESKVIKKWRDRSLERVGSNVNSNAQLKRGLNASTQLLKADHFMDRFIDTVCFEFESSSVQSEKNTMLDLCFQVMVADSYLHVNEARIINEFSNRCGISREQLNDYRDKLILEERLVFDATVPLDVFYGIDFFDDIESSKQFLMNEFKKWNMRINTLSPMKREAAQRMIDRISDARKRLK